MPIYWLLDTIDIGPIHVLPSGTLIEDCPKKPVKKKLRYSSRFRTSPDNPDNPFVLYRFVVASNFFGVSESANSLCWDKNHRLLIAGMNQKQIKLFDLRRNYSLSLSLCIHII